MVADELKISRLRLIVTFKQGPRGFRWKNVQNSDSMQFEGGFVEPETISVIMKDSVNSE